MIGNLSIKMSFKWGTLAIHWFENSNDVYVILWLFLRCCGYALCYRKPCKLWLVRPLCINRSKCWQYLVWRNRLPQWHCIEASWQYYHTTCRESHIFLWGRINRNNWLITSKIWINYRFPSFDIELRISLQPQRLILGRESSLIIEIKSP